MKVSYCSMQSRLWKNLQQRAAAETGDAGIGTGDHGGDQKGSGRRGSKLEVSIIGSIPLLVRCRVAWGF